LPATLGQPPATIVQLMGLGGQVLSQAVQIREQVVGRLFPGGTLVAKLGRGIL
jgi:hypothetical protein